MNLIGWHLVSVVADTTTAARPEAPGRLTYRRHGWHGIVGAVIWLAIIVYVLWLATRVVRAVEKLAEKYQGRTH